MTANVEARPEGLDRRQFLTRTATAVGALVVSGSSIICWSEAWGLEVKAIKPETARLLIKMARDIYPHNRVAEKFYAVAIKGLDEKAGKTAATRDMLDAGAAQLDSLAHAFQGVAYADMGWEADRVLLLERIERSPFFQAVRGDLVVSLYNQKEIWPLFGYEGESASKGGYINRGFSDINWL